MAEETNAQPQPTTPPAAPTQSAPPQAENLVPSFRLEQEISAKRQAVEAHQTASQELANLRSQLEQANQALAATKMNHSHEMTLIEQGFKAPSVRRFFRREYQAAVSELAGDERPTFDSWLEANREDPLYAVHFQNRNINTAATEAATEKTRSSDATDQSSLLQAIQAALTSNPNAGAGQPADTTAADYTDPSELRKLRAKNDGRLGNNKDAIKAQLRARGLIK
jgi:hypothetical protein